MNIGKELPPMPVTREQVVEAFKKVREKDASIDPWETNDETREAWGLYDSFYGSISTEKKRDELKPHELNQQVSLDLIMIDSGYKPDEESLGEAMDFLEQDLQYAEDNDDIEAVESIKEKIKELEKFSAPK